MEPNHLYRGLSCFIIPHYPNTNHRLSGSRMCFTGPSDTVDGPKYRKSNERAVVGTLVPEKVFVKPSPRLCDGWACSSISSHQGGLIKRYHLQMRPSHTFVRNPLSGKPSPLRTVRHYASPRHPCSFRSHSPDICPPGSPACGSWRTVQPYPSYRWGCCCRTSGCAYVCALTEVLPDSDATVCLVPCAA